MPHETAAIDSGPTPGTAPRRARSATMTTTMCRQQGCINPAFYRFTWPGTDESYICTEHVNQLHGIANATGLALQVLPLSSSRVAGEPAARAEDDWDALHGLARACNFDPTGLSARDIADNATMWVVASNRTAELDRLATRPSGAGAEAIVVTDAMVEAAFDASMCAAAEGADMHDYGACPECKRLEIAAAIAAAGAETGAR